MVIAADYPFHSIFWTMFVFFMCVIWFLLLVRVIGDIIGRHDISGWSKAAWTLLAILVPFLGVLIYLIVSGESRSRRDREQTDAPRAVR